MLISIWILFTVSFLIILISFIMSPDSNASSGALVGSADLDLFKQSKERGTKKFIKWAMFAAGLALLIVSLVMRSQM